MIMVISVNHLIGLPAELVIEFGAVCVAREGETAPVAAQLIDSFALVCPTAYLPLRHADGLGCQQVTARNGDLEVEHFVAIANLFDTTHRPCHDMLLEVLPLLQYAHDAQCWWCRRWRPY